MFQVILVGYVQFHESKDLKFVYYNASVLNRNIVVIRFNGYELKLNEAAIQQSGEKSPKRLKQCEGMNASWKEMQENVNLLLLNDTIKV